MASRHDGMTPPTPADAPQAATRATPPVQASRGYMLALLAAMVATVGFIATLTIALHALISSLDLVIHTHEVRVSLERLQLALTEAETAERGFLLAQSEQYLSSYLTGQEQVHRELETLRRLTEDNPRQRRRFPDLEVLIRERLERIAENVRIGHERGLEASVARVKEGTGAAMMDRVRAVLRDMQGEEARLLDERAAYLRWIQSLIFYAAIGFGALLVGLLVLTYRQVAVSFASERRISAHTQAMADDMQRALAAAEMTSAALAGSERRYRQLIDQIHDGVFIAQDYRIAFANDAFARMLGRSPQEVVGLPFDKFVAAEDLATWTERFSQRIAGGEATNQYIVRLVRSDGTVRMVELHAERIEHDGRAAVFGTLNDVSEREAAVRRLAENEARLRSIMDHAVDAIVTIDPRGIITSVNRATTKLFGYTDSELLGQNVTILMGGSDAERHGQYIGAYLKTGVRRIIGIGREVEGRHKSGRRFPVDLGVGELVDAEGGRIFIGTLRDLSERKLIEAQLRQAQKMEAVGQLTGGVAHDFNNLLAVMMGNLELIDERLSNDPAGRQAVDMAMKAATRGAELTHRLLAFSRQQVLRPAPTDVNGLVRAMSGMLERTLGETIEVRTVLAAGLWPAIVDPGELESAILNLAVNARDAMPKGGRLLIETSNAALDEDYAQHNLGVAPGRYVVVAVTDTGSGMPPGIVERAFEPFFTTKEVGKGTGLGLSMVYGFARQSGGNVKIYSEVGAGTTVRLYLPRASAEAGSEPEARAEERAAFGEGRVILVVEDDLDLRALAARLLSQMGFEPVTAADGAEALRRIDADPRIVLILSDLVLPKGMNGVAVAKEAAARRPSLKTIFMSGYSKNAALESDAIPEDAVLLNKPFRRADLARAMRRVLDQS